MPEKTQLEPILLKYIRQDQKIVIEPKDEDRFVITMREAVAACGAYLEEREFGEQFSVLLNRCAAWLDKNKQQIDGAYVTIQDGGILFLVIQKDKARNSSLSNDLSALDIEMANDDKFNLLDVNVLLLPKGTKEDIRSFINHEFLLQYRI